MAVKEKNRIGVIQMLTDLKKRVETIEESLGIDPDEEEKVEDENTDTDNSETSTSL